METNSQDAILISPGLSIGDWKRKRLALINDINENGNSSNLWEDAFNYFSKRIRTRFLDPIKWIILKGEDKGEGFSAVALQCILIEFLESFYQGKVYTTGEPGPFEYNKSRSLFIDFLMKHEPFSNYFTTRRLASDFYNNLRCGLLHEAATKLNWIIRKDNINNNIFSTDINYNIIYIDPLSEGITKVILNYKLELFAKKELKINFVRKFDDIGQIKRVLYFAYGSNINIKQLSERIRKYHIAIKGILRDYKFKYNKKSIDGTAKANIVKEKAGQVHGICYEIDKDDLTELRKKEIGYNQVEKEIILQELLNKHNKAWVFESNSILEDIEPSQDYRAIIKEGARYWNFPEDYIDNTL